MEKNVIDADLAKRMQDAGFSQDSVYKWYEIITTGEMRLLAGEFNELEIGGKPTRCFAAPTSEEIAVAMPKQLKHKTTDYFLTVQYDCIGGETTVSASYEVIGQLLPMKRDIEAIRARKRSCDALGELWLHCKEHGYV